MIKAANGETIAKKKVKKRKGKRKRKENTTCILTGF
ncbi:hypothetical protein DFR60_10338 [Hungatella effluvii]|uniref:Uncharacterized protein n=1 Tax=Hungatella effluvii TaxID=1096246 RepID=A0A2V3Y9V4_9FIRM|nr:hypothetical protein DFR60_10338 [Hungatella effluvii]